jgi:protease-4
MKNFFTSLLGALVALIVFCGGALLLFIGIIGAIVTLSGDKKAPAFERGSYLVYDLAANITDAPPVIDFGQFGGAPHSTLQLRSVTRAIRAAKTDDRIAGLVITGSLTPSGYGSGLAALKEVREALLDFKSGGKPVRAYLESVTTKDYFLASVAGEVALDPYGLILMPGLASEPMFFAGMLEKFGIGVQLSRAGKYKAFGEPFTRKEMSAENREETQKLLGDLWGSLRSDIAAARGLTVENLQAVVDAEGIIRPEAALNGKLIDRIAYLDQVLAEIRAKTGSAAGDKISFKQINLGAYVKIAKDVVDIVRGHEDGSSGGRGRIAIVYAEGDIVDGDGGHGDVGGVRFAKEIRRLRQDSNVKAIVLRVNSPGGSASASEHIGREIQLAKKVKPVVVSMGSYAASGGYWIAAYGDRIFAEPTTVTGSIGVFGLQFDVQKLANNVGITFDSVKTGRYADMLTLSRPKTEAELDIIQRMIDWTYGEFLRKVSEGRKLQPEAVAEIAQGRVWSGAEAKKIGLVDELGGLDTAIKFAAEKAGLGRNYRIVEFPQKKEFAEAVTELMERLSPEARTGSDGVVAEITRRFQKEVAALKNFNDPQGIYARMPLELSIR